MARFTKKRSHKAGLPPGTPRHVGDQAPVATRMRVLRYGPEVFEEQADEGAATRALKQPGTIWIQVSGLGDLDRIEGLGGDLDLHPLVIEDIVNTDQRPKHEDHGDYLFVVLRMLSLRESDGEVVSDLLSLVLGRNYVVTVQERDQDIFEPLQLRLRAAAGKFRQRGPDFLLYAVMDAVVDHYFAVLERLGEEVDRVEQQLIVEPRRATLHDIHRLKRDVLLLRRAVWPLREVIAALERSDSALIGDDMRIYLRDIYDHTVHTIETVDTLRDMLSGMVDIYLSSTSYRLNEVMKLLTIIATVFIPLSFITGIYGMNFEHMPELHWHWGYPLVMLVMLGIGIAMLLVFVRKKWL